MDAADIRIVIHHVAQLVADRYVSADVGATVSHRISDHLAAGRYDDLADVSALAELITSDLQSVNGDKHLRLLYSCDEVVHEDDDAGQLAALARSAELHSGGVARVERLAGNVGYLNLRPVLFPPAVVGTHIAAAMTLLASTGALIIDVRECIGGDPSMVALICSYLFDDEPVHLIDICERAVDKEQTRQFWTLPQVAARRFGATKKIYVLTSRATFSGAEDLCFDLQELGRAVVVGERTGGGAHPREGFRVHPHLEATIPVARAISPRTGRNWEGTGVMPDLEMPSDAALDAATRHALQALGQDA